MRELFKEIRYVAILIIAHRSIFSQLLTNEARRNLSKKIIGFNSKQTNHIFLGREVKPVQGGESNPREPHICIHHWLPVQLTSKQITSDAKSSASSPNPVTPAAFTSVNKRAESLRRHQTWVDHDCSGNRILDYTFFCNCNTKL